MLFDFGPRGFLRFFNGNFNARPWTQFDVATFGYGHLFLGMSDSDAKFSPDFKRLLYSGFRVEKVFLFGHVMTALRLLVFEIIRIAVSVLPIGQCAFTHWTVAIQRGDVLLRILHD